MFPNWLRIILSLLTIASFIPQFHLIWSRKSANGISLLYVLYNLISATEQFALNFGFVVLAEAADDAVFVHNPPTVGDWLNFAQTIVFMSQFLVYFALALWFPSKGSTPPQKRLILGTYVVYLVIAIVPLLVCAIVNSLKDDQSAWHELPMVLTFTPHTMYLNYVATVAAMLGTYYEILVLEKKQPETQPVSSIAEDHSAASLPTREEGDDTLNSSSPNGSLSLLGLAVQYVLFIVLAVSWIFRVSFPPLPDGAHWWSSSSVLEVWYELVGSIAVDNAVFAIGQGILLYLACKKERCDGDADGQVEGEEGFAGEREPLLRGPM
ncbi:hypothetical protein BJX63DRAFT_411386 [Aspergillus granulosus]|uniref:Uncharacterized protein n=1 Tax=Aspergillus granulosus TaxID=176169 RepID=A0ABR4GX23_9EURO